MSVPLDQPASGRMFVAFDTETTGLSPVDDRIVELAAVSFRSDGEVISTLEQLIDPGIPIPPLLTRIHGITDAMVAGMPPLEKVLPDFVRFLGDGILLAHNAPYDVSMILMPLMRLTGGAAPGNLVLDTCALSRAVFPGAPNYKLSTVAALLGVATGTAHRAMADVHACKGIFEKIIERRGISTTVSDLVALNGSELLLGLSEEMLLQIPRRLQDAALLGEAIRRGEPLRISYLAGTKGPGPRMINPITLTRQADGIHLLAHCAQDRSVKNFRLEKVSAIYPASAC